MTRTGVDRRGLGWRSGQGTGWLGKGCPGRETHGWASLGSAVEARTGREAGGRDGTGKTVTIRLGLHW